MRLLILQCVLGWRGVALTSEKLPTVEGLVIRPAVVDRARQTKKMYAHIKARMRLRQCSALKQSNRRRHKGSSSYRNRVGIRADRLRKVM